MNIPRMERVSLMFRRMFSVNPSDFLIRFVEKPNMKVAMKYVGDGKFYVSESFLNLSDYEFSHHFRPSVLFDYFYDAKAGGFPRELHDFLTVTFGTLKIETIETIGVKGEAVTLHIIDTHGFLYVCTTVPGLLNLDFQLMPTDTSLQPIIIEKFGLLFYDQPNDLIDFDVQSLVTNVNEALIRLGHEQKTIFAATEGYVFKYFGAYFTVYRKDGEGFFITCDEDNPLCNQCKLLDNLLSV